MFKSIFNIPVLNFIFTMSKAIPIDSKEADPEAYELAFLRISEELRDGQVVCIFPEGKLTTTGEIDIFHSGISEILARDAVSVIPMALRGLWGSFFRHKGSPALAQITRRFCSRVELIAGNPINPADASPECLQESVRALRGRHQ
jgi:1-acyl-sn-glycerol-3-phosphate acyltransferase